MRQSINTELLKNEESPARGKYKVYSDVERADIAKYAILHGSPATQKKFNIPEATVRRFKNICKKRKLDIEDVDKLPVAKRGRKVMLGEAMDKEVFSLLVELRNSGAVVNSAITKAVARGYLLAKDRSLLREFGGHIELTKDWAISLLRRNNFVKRRGSAAIKVKPSDLETLRSKFIEDVKNLIEKYNIPPELVVNFDHTGLNILPVSN